jgi:hypothetical protein
MPARGCRSAISIMGALISPRGLRATGCGNNGRVKSPAAAARTRGTSKECERRPDVRPPARRERGRGKRPGDIARWSRLRPPCVAPFISATAPAIEGRVHFGERLPLHAAGYNRRNRRSGCWQLKCAIQPADAGARVKSARLSGCDRWKIGVAVDSLLAHVLATIK